MFFLLFIAFTHLVTRVQVKQKELFFSFFLFGLLTYTVNQKKERNFFSLCFPFIFEFHPLQQFFSRLKTVSYFTTLFFLVLKGLVQQHTKKKEAFFYACRSFLGECRDVFECLQSREFVWTYFYFWSLLFWGVSTLKMKL